jgi:uncharacterized protein YceH (UPF0502 family)
VPALRPLDPFEQRVVGCLVEKELSTPDAYPLTLNALVAACNQTSNREPVSRLAAEDVEAALHRLMGDLLVWRDRGGRALRWKHSLDDKLGVRERPAKAVLAELLLRGPQTPGELRARTPRMHEFGGLGEVESALAALRAQGLVEELPRQPGQKERRWRHLLGSGAVPAVRTRPAETMSRTPEEPPAAHATQAEGASMSGPAAPRPVDPPVSGDGDLRLRVAALERRIEDLAAIVARLTR